MKKTLIFCTFIALLMSSCVTTTPLLKSVAYKGVYTEKPVSVLIMPPINKSTNVDAKEYFHSTLNVPLANAGYYVIPPFLSMEILKKESAYDSELFLNSPLIKFYEVFGADIALFTIINKWDKSGLMGKVYVEIEYRCISTHTNEVIYSRKGAVTYDTSVSSGSASPLGMLASMAATAINTAATKYIDVAKTCNAYTFSDIPSGKYSPNYGVDSTQVAGSKEFRVQLNSNYK